MLRSASDVLERPTARPHAVEQIPVLRDNYIYLIDLGGGAAAVVDPAVSEPVEHRLQQKGWRLTHILNTHHHADHTGANLALKHAYHAEIIGPSADRDRIPGLDHPVADGDVVTLPPGPGEGAGAKPLVGHVMATPGHTRGHIVYWFAEAGMLFCGDTLFSLGCGRLFEGTPQQMWKSLQMIRGLPSDTMVYCAHEYTQANALFALSVDPDNVDLKRRAEWVTAMREAGRPTVPSRLGTEVLCNPFLRADNERIAEELGMEDANPAAVFAELRKRKDVFQ